MAAIVGIDLGTTNSLVSVFRDGAPVTIPNALGDILTPSAVCVDDDRHVLVGRPALDRLVSRPAFSASEFKRAMGTDRRFTLGERHFRAEELSALVLRALKTDAEAFLGTDVSDAVISVPAYFNDNQRTATETAGQLAGLTVRRLVNEPTAAALAYGLHRRDAESKFIVLDLGGGTFDVSILELFDGIMEVRGVAGDSFLGGKDFAEALQQHLVERAGHKTSELKPDERAKLRNVAVATMHRLSAAVQATATFALGDTTHEVRVERGEFTELVAPLIDKIRTPIERALRDSGAAPEELDDVLLVGGATRMPVVRQAVGRLFGRLPSTQLDADRVVAFGTAVQAALLADDAALQDRVLTDVCPFTLGVAATSETESGRTITDRFVPIIERNTIIPASRVERFWPDGDYQDAIAVCVFQGESRDIRNNMALGELKMRLPSAKSEDNPLDIRFSYDSSGLLDVEVTALKTGTVERLIIKGNASRLSPAEVAERLRLLESLKIHPRDIQANIALLARADRLHEEALGDVRQTIAALVDAFESVLETQDTGRIERERRQLAAQLDVLEESWSVL